LLYDKTEDANFLPLSKRGIEGDLSIAYYAANPLEIPPRPPFAKGVTILLGGEPGKQII